jgi:alkylhydroperoxidase family enzyme
MARVRYISEDELPDDQKHLIARPIYILRALVGSPGLTAAYCHMGGYIRRQSKLDSRLRELVILQVGWLARNPYEWSHHIKIGKEFGVSDADIRAIPAETRGETTSLDETARLALKGAREMTLGSGMTDETFARLNAILGDELLIDLVGAIAFYVATVKILDTLKIDVEPEYQQYLDEYPLPAE